MGLLGIAKAPVSHGVEPHDLETGPGLRVPPRPFAPPAVPSRRYRASGLVLTSTPVVLPCANQRQISTILWVRLHADFHFNQGLRRRCIRFLDGGRHIDLGGSELSLHLQTQRRQGISRRGRGHGRQDAKRYSRAWRGAAIASVWRRGKRSLA